MLTGLIDSSKGETYWSENARRKVFYQYPQGKAPLMGLLSMVDNRSESTDKPKFGWWEQRFEDYTTKTAANSTGAFGDTSTTPADLSSPFTKAAGDVFTVFVDDNTKFRERDVIWVKDITTSGADIQLKAIVEGVDASTNYLTVRALNALSGAINTAASVDLDVILVSTAAGEGDRSRIGQQQRPIYVENNTQILRTAFSLSRNALKAGLRYDSTGEYRSAAKLNAHRHMIGLERAFFWGDRYEDTIVNDDGEVVPRRFMGGLEWFLTQWELGNTSNGGAFEYRPGGSNISTAAWATTDEKRICEVNGSMTARQFDDILERLFRYTNDTAFEKVCLCGSGFAKAFNRFVDASAIANRQLFSNAKGGFNFKTWESPFGIIHIKTHPLMNHNPIHRNDAYFLDLGDFVYTYVDGSDTNLLKMRHANDADKRKDEWFTECGLELRYPEQNLILRGVTSIA